MPAIDDTFQNITDGGVTAGHVVPSVPQGLVAPTHSSKEHNTIKVPLIPFACWRADDVRFEFESSFVLPEMAEEMKSLKDLIQQHTVKGGKSGIDEKPGLSVFGHADPTGSDDFNKALSGRRAQAVYGMLIRKTELWEDLYSNPLGNDKWEPKAIHRMQTALGQPTSDHPSASARKALFKAYMDHVCTARNEDGQPVLDDKGQPIVLLLKPTDFLANGADANGKGDFQGCGEFNPVLLFSQAENQTFSDLANKETRDQENGPNRRVLIFLFRPGLRIEPSNWPCPRVKEGVQGCKKRFWSDGEKRRNNRLPDKRREYKDSQDTFACRFYDRLSNNSPCERLDRDALSHISVLLRSNSGAMPLANMPYKIQIGEARVLQGKTDKDGLIEHDHIPPGDYELELNGQRTSALVPTLPLHLEKRSLRVAEFFLFDDGPSTALTDVDGNEDLSADGGQSSGQMVV